MKLLNEIVKQMIEEHEGGEKFFENLDESIQKEPIVDQLFWYLRDEKIIVSGKFGIFLSNYLSDQHFLSANIILVNGGLRIGDKITDLSYLKDKIEGFKFVFMDDSFYSGKTRDSVKSEIEKLGGILTRTIVVYDGSLIEQKDVISLYRYYDNYKEKI